MFCGKCGAQNADQAAFCQTCGAALGAEQVAPEAAYEAPPVQQPQNKNRLVGGIAVAAIVVIVIILLSVLLGGKGYEKVAVKYFESVFDGNGKTYVSLIPDKVVDEILDEGDYDNKKELIEEIDEGFEDITEMMKEEDVSVSFKVNDTDDYKSKELRELQEEYEDEYDIKVKDAKRVEVKVTAKVDGDKESVKIEVPVIKVGGSWYVDAANASNPLSLLYMGMW